MKGLPVLELKQFVHQVLVDGSLVVVIDDHAKACKFAEKNFKGAHVVILPVPVFTCQ